MNLKIKWLVAAKIFHMLLIASGEDYDFSDLDTIKQFQKTLGKPLTDQKYMKNEKKTQDNNNSKSPNNSKLGTNQNSANSEPLNEELIEKFPESTDESLNSKNDACGCVKYFQCNVEDGDVITNGDGVNLIDIRLGGLNEDYPCEHYFDICCKELKNDTEKVNPTPSHNHESCGKRNPNGVGFQITGAMDHEAQFGEFPWMAAIVKEEPQKGKPPLNIFVCGGSLIHPKVVLTAGHCVFGKDPKELKVRLGEWDTQTPDEIYPYQDKPVSKIIVHEKYYVGALYSDIALIFLTEEIKFAPNVDTVCLSSANVNFDRQRCLVSGWGKDSFGQKGKYQVILKRLEVPIVPTRRCQNQLRRTRLGPSFVLDESFVCAGGEFGQDTCKGDGGSPLVCKLPNSESYIQFGIVAWGIGCGGETPGVYVNVPKFVPWIEEKLIEYNLNTVYYKNS